MSPPPEATLLINPAYYRKTAYDPLKDFDPVTVVAETPYLLLVHAALPYAGSLKQFIAAAKAQLRQFDPEIDSLR